MPSPLLLHLLSIALSIALMLTGIWGSIRDKEMPSGFELIMFGVLLLILANVETLKNAKRP